MGLARRADPQARKNNAGRVRTMNSKVHSDPVCKPT